MYYVEVNITFIQQDVGIVGGVISSDAFLKDHHEEVKVMYWGFMVLT
jgi:hypothetical protein